MRRRVAYGMRGEPEDGEKTAAAELVGERPGTRGLANRYAATTTATAMTTRPAARLGPPAGGQTRRGVINTAAGPRGDCRGGRRGAGANPLARDCCDRTRARSPPKRPFGREFSAAAPSAGARVGLQPSCGRVAGASETVCPPPPPPPLAYNNDGDVIVPT